MFFMYVPGIVQADSIGKIAKNLFGRQRSSIDVTLLVILKHIRKIQYMRVIYSVIHPRIYTVIRKAILLFLLHVFQHVVIVICPIQGNAKILVKRVA